MPQLATQHPNIPTKDLISWIFDDPPYDVDEPIYIDAARPSRTISNRQARKLIRQLVAGFRAAGIPKGTTIALHSFNDIYYSILFLAIIAAGCQFAGTNPSYTPHELEHHLRSASVHTIIAEEEILTSILPAAEKNNIPRSRIFLFDHDRDPPDTSNLQNKTPFPSWRSFFNHGEQDWVRFDDLQAQTNTVAGLMFSSGTTGLPKAAELSHRNFVAEHTLCWELFPRDYRTRRLNPLPEFHVAVAPVIHTTALKAGHVTYIQRRFEVEPYLEYLKKYKITDMTSVPPVVISILNRPDLLKAKPFECIRSVLIGAAPLGAELQARFLKTLIDSGAGGDKNNMSCGKPVITQVWGMTETTCIATMLPWPDPNSAGDIGVPIPGIDIKIVDEDGRDVTADDVEGELCVRGPTVIRRYVPTAEGKKANENDWDNDGFFHTGDVALRHGKTGRWYIVDRKKELIKVRAFQVAPSEIEAVLLAHDGIADTGVIGLPAEGTELPCAYVVKATTHPNLSEDDVKNHVADKLARFKHLTGGVRFIDAIPRNASGKILRRVLRDMAKETKAKL